MEQQLSFIPAEKGKTVKPLEEDDDIPMEIYKIPRFYPAEVDDI